ncbi:uncharacterized protein LOC123553908 isoform X3 [Mercenaria mercenaria]|uniref:uncharacterized protein LOC123553908 isoform X3 n=1 Tax=Mercenaria mercenaria TaxID=6596 RepID=UPI00234E90B0|nr:uncharacterized protein LOC123553908 isoform X3 [Mercenaria mercenaria]
MYTHSRLTSESSNATNASGSTEQTDLSDDIVSDSTKKATTQNGQGIGYLGQIRIASAIDSNVENQRENAHAQKESDGGGYFKIHVPSTEQEVRHVWIDSQRGNFGTKCESVPLLLRNERQYAVQDIIRSEDFKIFFETEYAEIAKFMKNYKSLKKCFLILAVLNIILIICAVSVMPVILVSFRLGNGHVMSDKGSLDVAMEEFVFEKLNFPRAREIIRQHVPCDDCRRLSDELETYKSDIQQVRDSIDTLENAVISLHLNGSNTGNATRKYIQNSFQKTSVHRRVEYNNRLLNKLLNWKRSSMQLIGTVINGQIVWEDDVLNGNIMSRNNKGIHVKSGGTYFVYSNIRFEKRNCTGNEQVLIKSESTKLN